MLNDGPLLPCALLAAVVHEAGHFFAIYLSGGGVKRFVLHPFGAEIVTDGKLLSYGQSAFVALSGIGVNLLCALPLFLSGAPLFVQVFSACSLGLALFNLLPLSALDGGEALRVFFSMLFGPDKGGSFCRFCTLAGAVGLFVFMLCGVMFFRFNPLFLLLVLYLLWGVF